MTKDSRADRDGSSHSPANATDVAVGGLLRDARHLAGIAQRTLAATIGVSVRCYQMYESGRKRMAPAQLVALATALDVPMAYFFQDIPPRPGLPSCIGPFTPDEIEIIRGYRAIEDVELRAALRHMLRSVGGRFRPGLMSTPTFQRKR